MTYWEETLKENHCGYGKPRRISWYAEKLKEHPIEAEDLSTFQQVIEDAMTGNQGKYDSFPDEGGIDIAALLLAQVWLQMMEKTK